MSDLDLLLFPPVPLSALERALLRDDFSESDLPFRVDIIDAATTAPDFLRAIEPDSVLFQ